MKNKYQILVFSPTGNTYYLAKILSKILDCEVIGEQEKISCEHLIIMSSIHAFKIPLFLKNKIKDIVKLSIIAVGCNTSWINKACGYHLIKKAKKLNIELKTYQILAMPLTIVKKFELDYGRKIISQSMKDIESMANNILNNKDNIIDIPVKSKIISNVYYIENLFVKLFGLELKANKSCIKCGKCVKTCPKKNIKMKHVPKFGINCMMCMSCIYKCPAKAIHPRISKFVEHKNGYILEEYLKK